MTAIDDSLRRLWVDHIDLYQVHRPEPSVPIGETVEALTDLVRVGKIPTRPSSPRSSGCSGSPMEQASDLLTWRLRSRSNTLA